MNNGENVDPFAKGGGEPALLVARTTPMWHRPRPFTLAMGTATSRSLPASARRQSAPPWACSCSSRLINQAVNGELVQGFPRPFAGWFSGRHDSV